MTFVHSICIQNLEKCAIFPFQQLLSEFDLILLFSSSRQQKASTLQPYLISHHPSTIRINDKRKNTATMVGTEQPHFKLKDDKSLIVDTSSNANAIVRHDSMLLSPSSSHSSDYSDNASTSASLVSDQKAIKKFDDNSETTSSNDRLDR